jgi:hypothetical protein
MLITLSVSPCIPDTENRIMFSEVFRSLSKYLSKEETRILLCVAEFLSGEKIEYSKAAHELGINKNVVKNVYQETVAKLKSIAQHQPEIQDLLKLAFSDANY